MSERLAIIGAGGYVGARFVERSELAGDLEIVPIVRSPRSEGRLARYGACTVQADAGDVSSLVGHLKNCRMAVNLTLGDYGRVVSDTRAIHEACRRAGVPLLIHMSSAEVFGRADAPNLTEKSIPAEGHWMEYARVKAAAEAWLTAQPSGSVATVILRPGLVWGPGSRWLAGPAQELSKGGAYLFGDGRGVCNLIHVDNLIEHVLHLARSHEIAPGAFNVADDELHCWKDYYESIAGEIGVDPATIHLLPDSAYREGVGARIEVIRNSAAARAIKSRMSESRKIRMKHKLIDQIRPPMRQAQPYSTAPTVTKGMWWLQGTVRKLPSRFKASYPGLQLKAFPELISAAGHWLRYAGYERDIN